MLPQWHRFCQHPCLCYRLNTRRSHNFVLCFWYLLPWRKILKWCENNFCSFPMISTSCLFTWLSFVLRWFFFMTCIFQLGLSCHDLTEANISLHCHGAPAGVCCSRSWISFHNQNDSDVFCSLHFLLGSIYLGPQNLLKFLLKLLIFFSVNFAFPCCPLHNSCRSLLVLWR